MSIAWETSFDSLAFFFGGVVGLLITSPFISVTVVYQDFWGVTLRVLGTASLLCLFMSFRDGDSYPVGSMLGGIIGLVIGAIWSWLRVPHYMLHEPGECASCGYSLLGLDLDAVCPECAHPR